MPKPKSLALAASLLLTGMTLTSSAFAAFEIGDTLFIDFGPNNTTNGIIMPTNGTMNTAAGNSTGAADTFGHYWNNATSGTKTAQSGGYGITALSNLVDAYNVGTGIGLSFDSKWQANGGSTGGLYSPSSSLLGDFASQNATFDYFFVDSTTSSATMTFSGLNPELTYNFDMFGSRENTVIRTSLYTITGGNGTYSATLTTSGTDIGTGGYDGNNDTIASLDGIAPTEDGTITLTLSSTTSSSYYGYISALQLTAVPEPASAGMFAALGCLALALVHHKRTKSKASI